MQGYSDNLKDFPSHWLFVKLWVITTNDNLDALRFYQKRGYTITKVHTDALKGWRKQKPEIPETGFYDIPIRDEIELEKDLH